MRRYIWRFLDNMIATFFDGLFSRIAIGERERFSHDVHAIAIAFVQTMNHTPGFHLQFGQFSHLNTHVTHRIDDILIVCVRFIGRRRMARPFRCRR